MELNGEQLIAAPVSRVWLGLNDVSILHASIPGCEEIERISRNTLYFFATRD
jgi:carbon monoxide dehydrogenase subunit G